MKEIENSLNVISSLETMKIICMIPVRKGSQRVTKKALRKIGSTTLIEQAITLSLQCFKPEDIYLNSDWEDMRDIASKYKIILLLQN